jgi:outer membrane translocation and assembly module TamA
MRILVGFLLFFFVIGAGFGQEPSTGPMKKVWIGKLVIESNSLPYAERERVVRLFEHKAFFQEEIAERIRGSLRNRGYFKATVEEPEISPTLHGAGTGADVRVKFDEGRQYRLGEIRIQKATIFPSATLRNLFQLQRSDVFDVAKVGKGLENIRELYGTRGYVNVVAIPEVVSDESRGVVDLAVSVDEGKPVDFGKLYLEGVEPYPGAAQALLNSWKTLEGKRYNSIELRRWFAENRSHWKVTEFWRSVRFTPTDSEYGVVNVTLSQWDGDGALVDP